MIGDHTQGLFNLSEGAPHVPPERGNSETVEASKRASERTNEQTYERLSLLLFLLLYFFSSVYFCLSLGQTVRRGGKTSVLSCVPRPTLSVRVLVGFVSNSPHHCPKANLEGSLFFEASG